MRKYFKNFLILFAISTLSGCSTVSDILGSAEAPPLEGERISVLELQRSLEPDDTALEQQGLLAPAPWNNAFWPQAGGYPNHSMQNLALPDGQLKCLWKTSIGAKATDELPLMAQPILVDGQIYTLDTKSQLSAFNAENGELIWRVSVKDPKEDDYVISGGIAYATGMLYVTNGYNEILALRPPNGEILWRKELPSPSRAAPTILNGRLFISTLDNRLLAMNASTGEVLWEHQGLSEFAGLVGAASPAASHDIVVPVFSSGEITALRVENGSVAWSDNLSNLRRFGGLSGLSDIKALPVIDKGLIIAISFSGKLVAIDERTGVRVWQREIGGTNTPWVAGNHLFVLSSDNQLVALGRKTGAIRWVKNLKSSRDGESVFYTGPILAGGRLILINTEGLVIEVNPENGEKLAQWNTNERVTLPPIIANKVLYILSDDGILSAYN